MDYNIKYDTVFKKTEARKNTQGEEKSTRGENKDSTIDPMLLALTTGRHPTVVEMGILGTTLIYEKMYGRTWGNPRYGHLHFNYSPLISMGSSL